MSTTTSPTISCPVSADAPAVEVMLLSEQDDRIGPAGVRGLGELGNVGTNAAVCNAIFNATGQRIRKLRVRLENIETRFDGSHRRCIALDSRLI